MKEIWKDIKDYPGYQASNLGRIRTFNKTTYSKRYGIRKWKDRVLKLKTHHIRKRKFYRITLWKDGKPKELLVARLVAFTFFAEDINNKKLTVNHKDGNPLNNNIENLELISLKDNIIHAYKTGLNTKQKKVKIINKTTNEGKTFRALYLGSLYMGKGKAYLSLCKSKNRMQNDDFKWEF